jgi:DNA polymerase-1
MLDFAMQRPLSHIGFDTEFKYDRHGIFIDKRNTAYDPSSIHPLLLSLSMAESNDNGNVSIYTFVVESRKPELLPTLKELFKLPIIFVGHFAKVELFCLWQLGLQEPDNIWDTYIFEKLLNLGRDNIKQKLRGVSKESDQIKIKEVSEEQKKFSYSLVATCQRYGVSYRMAGEKERLQKSFLDHPEGSAYSEEQISYSAEDAIATAQLYPLQINKA